MSGKCSGLHQLCLQKHCSFAAGVTRHFNTVLCKIVRALMFSSPTITVSKRANSVMPHSLLSKTNIHLPFDEFSLLSRKLPECGCFRLVVRPGLSGNGGERICQRTKMKGAESITLFVSALQKNILHFFRELNRHEKLSLFCRLTFSAPHELNTVNLTKTLAVSNF